MKYIRKYEELDEPKIGDYVILNVAYLSKEWQDFINNTPGKIIKKNGGIIKVKYTNFSNNIQDALTVGNERGVYVTTTSSIVVFAPTIKEVKLKFSANKYNI